MEETLGAFQGLCCLTKVGQGRVLTLARLLQELTLLVNIHSATSWAEPACVPWVPWVPRSVRLLRPSTQPESARVA